MRRAVELASGTLVLDVERQDLPLDALCGFADRHNVKRSFLFVSKVLGKHMPARPARMAEVHGLIAERISPALDGPVVFVALAETAVALGQAVYQAYRARTGREDTAFIHTTRYAVGEGPRLAFSESHSHAPSHLLHVPVDAEVRRRFVGARSLVVIDDEISTGNTLVSLIRLLRAELPELARVVLACITDWSGQPDAFSARAGIAVDVVSVLTGRFRFEPRSAPTGEAPPPAVEVRRFEPKDSVLGGNFGRLGVVDPPDLGALPAQLADLGPGQPPGPRRVLVLGTGEFLYLPFVLARTLEAAGHDVLLQSTTRSPIHVGGAIGCKLELIDNYFDGLPNFLYNVVPGDHDVVIACYETPRLPAEHTLPATLGARVWVPS